MIRVEHSHPDHPFPHLDFSNHKQLHSIDCIHQIIKISRKINYLLFFFNITIKNNFCTSIRFDATQYCDKCVVALEKLCKYV